MALINRHNKKLKKKTNIKFHGIENDNKKTARFKLNVAYLM